MATDTLATLLNRVRGSLADTGTDFTTAVIHAAIFEAVSDISRLAPLEALHVEVMHSRTVSAGTTPTLTDVGTWYNLLASGNVKPIDQQSSMIITSSDAVTTFTEYTDYIIDYAQGKIQRITGGAMTATTFLATYEKSLKGIDLSSLTNFLTVDRLEISKQGGRTFQEFSSFWQWGDILWLQSREGTDQGNVAENDHIRVWYKAEHTKPGGTAGSYPSYMDDIIVKGAVAYALFSKHRERNLQSVTDLATSRTQLAISDDEQGAIDTLETAVTTSLNSAQTGVVVNTILLDVTTALDSSIASNYEADRIADLTINDIVVALDRIIVLGADAEALLDSTDLTGMNGAILIPLAAAATQLGVLSALGDGVTLNQSTFLDANIALDKVMSLLEIYNTDDAVFGHATFTDINTAINEALDGAQAILAESSTTSAALAKVEDHLVTDTSPDSAEKQLAAGDSLINATNLGSDAPALYAKYAETQIGISDGFVREAQTRIAQARGQIEESSQRVAQRNSFLTEVSRRVDVSTAFVQEARERASVANARVKVGMDKVGGYIEEAAQRIALKQVYLAEVDRRITIANTYILEARERLGIAAALQQAAMTYIQEAAGRMQQADRHIALGAMYFNQATGWMQQIDRHLMLGNLYISQSRGYQEASDRETQAADRFLFDAQERHRDYWEHLSSRVEMTWPNPRKTSVRQNA